MLPNYRRRIVHSCHATGAANRTFKLPGFHMLRCTSLVERLPQVLLPIALIGLGVWLRWPLARLSADPPPLASGADTSTASGDSTKWLGAVSCASAACHNANGPQGSKGSEYTTWIGYDKHEKAYTVLLEPRSQTMVANYRHLQAGQVPHAESDLLCLSCHTGGEPGDRLAATNIDGVGCEACHGPAGKWVATHYLQGWKDKDPSEIKALGMRNTKDLATRAEVCADCHVGSKDRQVDHDLIAAGHPRLRFEFGAYLATMAKHWSDKDEKNAKPGFEARAWTLGQVLSAQAALKLLAGRAEDKPRPWPEFAEYDCFACHHDLQTKSWRQKRAAGQRAPGLLPWGTWYFSALALASDSEAATSDLANLRREMERTSPDRQEVSRHAREAVARLQGVLERANKTSYDQAFIRKLRDALANRPEGQGDDPSWDGAVQLYLARAALYAALGESGTPPSPSEQSVLKLLRRELEYPPGYDSPLKFNPYDFGKTYHKVSP
jgi:hypothetical protein